MSRVVPCWVRNRGRQRERQRPLHIGQRIRHESGVTVEIVNGQFLGGYGRISNFWYWRGVLPDGHPPVVSGAATERPDQSGPRLESPPLRRRDRVEANSPPLGSGNRRFRSSRPDGRERNRPSRRSSIS